ncbi:MAG TPA: thioredoxin family protein [Methylomirabilota bacterium]|nr:thioredoxin family protein [Methylomirabilota bacterium]
MVTAERFAQGLTVPEYVAQMHTNRDAFTRLLAEAPVRPEDREAIATLEGKIRILVITEDWCPDSLRTIPVLARLVDGLPHVEMRVLLRDANPDVMDQYLKRGQFRAIPVFAVFDEEMNEVGRMIEAKMNVVGQMRTLLKV